MNKNINIAVIKSSKKTIIKDRLEFGNNIN